MERAFPYKIKTQLNAAQLQSLLAILEDPSVQPGFPDEDETRNYFDRDGNEYYDKELRYKLTWCNRFLHMALKSLGYDARFILNKEGIGWTRAEDMCTNLRSYGREVADEHNVKSFLINSGPLIVCKSKGPGEIAAHVGLAVGVLDDPNTHSEIVVVEAGSEVGVHTLSRSNFASTKGGLTNVGFFQCYI